MNVNVNVNVYVHNMCMCLCVACCGAEFDKPQQMFVGIILWTYGGFCVCTLCAVSWLPDDSLLGWSSMQYSMEMSFSRLVTTRYAIKYIVLVRAFASFEFSSLILDAAAFSTIVCHMSMLPNFRSTSSDSVPTTVMSLPCKHTREKTRCCFFRGGGACWHISKQHPPNEKVTSKCWKHVFGVDAVVVVIVVERMFCCQCVNIVQT